MKYVIDFYRSILDTESLKIAVFMFPPLVFVWNKFLSGQMKICLFTKQWKLFLLCLIGKITSTFFVTTVFFTTDHIVLKFGRILSMIVIIEFISLILFMKNIKKASRVKSIFDIDTNNVDYVSKRNLTKEQKMKKLKEEFEKMKKFLLIMILCTTTLLAKETRYQQININSLPMDMKKHYGASTNNIFIDYENWKNTERNIQLSDEYRTYITPEQLQEFQKKLWIEYQKENMRHYIRMNEVQEYNSSRPDMIYIENNQYYRRRPVPYYW